MLNNSEKPTNPDIPKDWAKETNKNQEPPLLLPTTIVVI
jgi:hypothetical protein